VTDDDNDDDDALNHVTEYPYYELCVSQSLSPVVRIYKNDLLQWDRITTELKLLGLHISYHHIPHHSPLATIITSGHVLHRTGRNFSGG
jgi:hypothetical protein